MARLKKYEFDGLITENDFLIGTDADNNNITKSYKVGGIGDFITDKLMGDGTNYHVPFFLNNTLKDSVITTDPILPIITIGGSLIVEEAFSPKGVFLDSEGTLATPGQILQSNDEGEVVWKDSANNGKISYLAYWEQPDLLRESYLRQTGDGVLSMFEYEEDRVNYLAFGNDTIGFNDKDDASIAKFQITNTAGDPMLFVKGARVVDFSNDIFVQHDIIAQGRVNATVFDMNNSIIIDKMGVSGHDVVPADPITGDAAKPAHVLTSTSDGVIWKDLPSLQQLFDISSGTLTGDLIVDGSVTSQLIDAKELKLGTIIDANGSVGTPGQLLTSDGTTQLFEDSYLQNLQETLDAGNTATQDINLEGNLNVKGKTSLEGDVTITGDQIVTGNITQTGDLTQTGAVNVIGGVTATKVIAPGGAIDDLVTQKLTIAIVNDSTGVPGTEGQVLKSVAGNATWVDDINEVQGTGGTIPMYTTDGDFIEDSSITQALDNTVTIPLLESDNATIKELTAEKVTITEELVLNAPLTDGAGNPGQIGEVLTSTTTGVVWTQPDFDDKWDYLDAEDSTGNQGDILTIIDGVATWDPNIHPPDWDYIDSAGNAGNPGELLTINATGEAVYTTAAPTPNLAEVLDVGHTAPGNIVLGGSLNVGAFVVGPTFHGDEVVAFDMLKVRKKLEDEMDSTGNVGEVLTATATGTLWAPEVVPDLTAVIAAQSGVATGTVMLQGPVIVTSLVGESIAVMDKIQFVGELEDKAGSTGDLGQILTATTDGVLWANPAEDIDNFITGEGTINTIPLYDANKNIIDSIVVQEGTDAIKIGDGTTSSLEVGEIASEIIISTAIEGDSLIINNDSRFDGAVQLNGNIVMDGPVIDTVGASGLVDQVLASNGTGELIWKDLNTDTFNTPITINSNIIDDAGNAGLVGQILSPQAAGGVLWEDQQAIPPVTLQNVIDEDNIATGNIDLTGNLKVVGDTDFEGDVKQIGDNDISGDLSADRVISPNIYLTGVVTDKGGSTGNIGEVLIADVNGNMNYGTLPDVAWDYKDSADSLGTFGQVLMSNGTTSTYQDITFPVDLDVAWNFVDSNGSQGVSNDVLHIDATGFAAWRQFSEMDVAWDYKDSTGTVGTTGQYLDGEGKWTDNTLSGTPFNVPMFDSTGLLLRDTKIDAELLMGAPTGRLIFSGKNKFEDNCDFHANFDAWGVVGLKDGVEDSLGLIGTSGQLLSTNAAGKTEWIDAGSGASGSNGADGADGADGVDGIAGTNGTDGTNGTNGTNGTDGKDGTDGIIGVDGVAGTDGVDGVAGVDGKDGADGADGVAGTDGKDGSDGTNGVFTFLDSTGAAGVAGQYIDGEAGKWANLNASADENWNYLDSLGGSGNDDDILMKVAGVPVWTPNVDNGVNEFPTVLNIIGDYLTLPQVGASPGYKDDVAATAAGIPLHAIYKDDNGFIKINGSGSAADIPPVANNITITAGILNGGTGTATATGSDADGDTVSFAIVTQPTNSTVTIIPSTGVITINAGTVAGSDSFTYKAVTASADSTPATVNFSVDAAIVSNTAPVVTSVTYGSGIVNGALFTQDLAGTDADGDALTYSVVGTLDGASTATFSGSVISVNTGSLNGGTYVISFKANDGQADSNVGTLTYTVDDAPALSPPQAAGVIYDIGKNTGGLMGGTLLDEDMQGFDVNGLPLTYNVTTIPNGGTFTQTGTTSDFTYVPPLNITGKRTFIYTVNNGTETSAPATSIINILNIGGLGGDPVYTSIYTTAPQSSAQAVRDSVFSMSAGNEFSSGNTGLDGSNIIANTMLRSLQNGFYGFATVQYTLSQPTGTEYNWKIMEIIDNAVASVHDNFGGGANRLGPPSDDETNSTGNFAEIILDVTILEPITSGGGMGNFGGSQPPPQGS